jgi:hypothetical protein
MEIKLDTNVTVDDYIDLRKSVGWKEIKKEQIVKAINSTMYQIKAIYNDETVGMARLVGDYSFTELLTGVIVKPNHQKKVSEVRWLKIFLSM